ncbi:hypothetical protein E2C01_068916 [Portunus trituberculatus]|uniref:Uncharacterized protein n=1 Tax=Portunus trituberculatus TaxID=210409 RepID=A0A5B7HX79_PORTR|nr:hypothetical protein [Portunus trituberculatus]
MDKARSLWDAIKVEEEAEPQPSTSGPHQYEEFKVSGGCFRRFKKQVSTFPGQDGPWSRRPSPTAPCLP